MIAAIENLRDKARDAWRFRRTAIQVAWSLAFVGWVVVLAVPDVFQAQARVYVDTSTVLRPLLQGITVEQDIDSQLSEVRETLLGRPQLERVAREADLDLKVKNATEKDELIAKLRASISIDGVTPGSNRDGRRSSDSVYTITYQNNSRDRALTVVRSLLNSLVEDTLGGKRSGADAAQKFLRAQISDYEKRLSVSEAALADFKKRNVGLVPGSQGDYFSRLQAEIQATQKARSALELASRRREELSRQLQSEKVSVSSGAARPQSATGTNASATGSGESGGADTASRLAAAQARLDELLLRFTDKHPDVVAARETIEQLKTRQKQELDALRRGDPSAVANSGLTASPVYQAIQLQLNQTDVEIATTRGELAEHERAEGELRRVVNTAPEVEAEFSRLNRDYDVTKAQYNSLVDRLDKAKLSDDAQQTGVVRLEVIDPPTAATAPVEPKRPRLLALVLLAAFGAGIGAALVRCQLQPVFHSARKLAEATGVPVLGTVTMTWIDRATADFKRGIFVTAAAGAALIVAFLAVLVVQQPATRLLHSLISHS